LNTAKCSQTGENTRPIPRAKDYLSPHKEVETAWKRVKKKNVEIAGAIVFIEGELPEGKALAPSRGRG
jgi:hypothetical protein